MQKLYTTILITFGIFTSFNLLAQVYMADSTGVFKKKTPVSPVNGSSFREMNANNTIPASQDPTNLFPPSPTAAALARYGDIPVGYHTGTPNISVPLYEVKSKELSLPISLSYHASGIKVDEVSSWVGLGWSLNAGGVITRSVQSLPDEGAASSGDGYYSRPTKTFIFGRGCAPIVYYGVPRPPTYNFPLELCGDGRTPTSQQIQASAQTQQNWQNAEAGLIDMEPDIFFFNIGGFSGKFMFDSTGTPRFFPEQDIKVEVTHDPIARKFIQFKLITPDGTKYYFGGTHGDTNFTQGDPAVEATANQASNPYETSWFLTKIVSANGKSKIFFRYKSEEYGYYDIKNEYLSDNSGGWGGLPPPDYGIEKNKIDGVRLSHIYTSDNNTQIEFFANTKREDVSHYTEADMSGGVPSSLPDAYRLNEIRILNSAGIAQKKFVFEHDYFVSTGTPNFPELGGGPDAFTKDRKRLKLVSVTETSGDGSIVLPPYKFDYNTTINIPRRISFGRDHWGYYNGKEYSNRSLIHVQINGGDGVSVGAPYIVNASPFKTSDRTTVSGHVGFASLVKITYPTAGYTTFIYGTHQFGSITTPIGGLRIVSIKNYESNGNLLSQKDFDYNFSGKLFSIPTYYYQARISLLMWNVILYATGLPPVIGSGGDVKDIASSSPVLPLSTTQGSHIGYSRVTVKEVGNGKTVYTYNTDSGYPYPGGGSPPGKYDLFGIERLFNYPRDPVKDNYKLGQLEKEEVFNTNNDMISETINTYAISETFVNIPAIKIDGNSINSYQVTKMYNRYAFFTGRSDLTGKIIKTCDVNGTNCVTTNSTFAYDGTNINGRIKHFQMTSSTIEASNGDLIISKMKYAQDYTGASTDNGIAALRNNNMVMPIETNKIRRKGSGINAVESVLSGEITYFDPVLLKPSYKYILETAAPITNFTFSSVNGNTFTKDSRYTNNAAQYMTFYTDSGNIKEIYPRQGSNQVTTYLWGYNNALPIAEIKNVTYANVASTIGQATIDYLATSNTYTDASVRSSLSPILNINNSLATIYTYKPVVGITSTTAPSGLVTYYNYDALGRLINLMDNNEKIVKSYQYGYAITTSTSVGPGETLPNVLGPCGLINVRERSDIIEPGQTLTDEACQEVILKEGFHAKSGSEYVAKPKS